jgi:hypothetical protein
MITTHGRSIPSSIIVTALLVSVGLPKHATLEERIRCAMREVRKPDSRKAVMCSDENDQFRGAVGAVLLDCTPEERDRIEEGMRSVELIANCYAGGPVDMSEVYRMQCEPLGLLRLWFEAAPEHH